MLECRRLLATVTSLGDHGAGTLRDALQTAAPGETIDFGNLAGTITLQSPLTRSTNDVVISGPGRDALTIDARFVTQAFRFEDIAFATVRDLRIRAGQDGTPYGAGISMDGRPHIVDGRLTLENVDVTGGLAYEYGGGVYINRGHLVVKNSNIVGNGVTGPNAAGGGVAVLNAIAEITGSTVSGNIAASTSEGGLAAGGGIYGTNTNLQLLNSTIAENVARRMMDDPNGVPSVVLGGGVWADYGQIWHSTIARNAVETIDASGAANRGGGLYVPGNSNYFGIRNSVIASNDAPLDGDLSFAGISGAIVDSVIGRFDDYGSGLSALAQGSLIGTTANPVDAKLGTLSSNGGATQTIPLLLGSPAIDRAGNGASADQRGMSRGILADAGAYEYVGPVLPPVIPPIIPPIPPIPTTPEPVVPTFTRFPRIYLDDGATTGSFSAAASQDDSNVTFTWKRLSKPDNASDPILSEPTSARTQVTFAKVGTYEFRLIATNEEGESVSRKLTFTIDAVASALMIVQRDQTISGSSNTRMRVYGKDQFGGRMSETPRVSWSLLSGPGAITAGTGMYRPDAADSFGKVKVRATAGDLVATAVNYVRAA